MRRKPSGPPLFFAFPDGVYHYVCAECTAICCRGQGFGGSLRREMATLLTLYPSLGAAAASRHGDILKFRTAPPACFFLDRDNLCRIEKQHGRALKPGVCTLFPFNVFTRVGRTIAVTPHFLCPLRLEIPPRPGAVEGTHALLEAAVRESGLLDEGYLQTFRQAALPSSLGVRSVLEREACFRDACAQDLGRRRFLECLRDASSEPLVLDAFLARATCLMGLGELPDTGRHDHVDDILLALAPPQRLDLLDLSNETMMRVLALGERVARSALSLSSEEPTLQAVHRIIESVVPALKLLALGDEPVEFLVRKLKLPPLGPDLTFAAFVAAREGPRGTLQALEDAIRPSFSLADRWVLLNCLGERVAPRPRAKSRAEPGDA